MVDDAISVAELSLQRNTLRIRCEETDGQPRTGMTGLVTCLFIMAEVMFFYVLCHTEWPAVLGTGASQWPAHIAAAEQNW
jgi:hypothetical protein